MNKTETVTMYSVVGIISPLRKVKDDDGIILQVKNSEWGITDIQYGRNEKGKLARFILTIDRVQVKEEKEE